jgi:tetratricopeptide (TPR) repeat protein
MHAKEAYRKAEHMGDLYLQVWSLYLQARCHAILANYGHATHLLQNSKEILAACGQEQSAMYLSILHVQAEVYLLKGEYLESRNLQVAIASSCLPTSYSTMLANLNTVFIDIAIGAESKLVHKNLDNCQSHVKELYGFHAKYLGLIADYIAAELCLQDGDHVMANPMFKKLVISSQKISPGQLTLQGLARLSDLSTQMNNIMTTLQWVGVFLSMALKCKDKCQTMQAFRCLGQIFSAKGDAETALSLFKVALDGFTFMDVHHWRADCMVRIADILNDNGEVMKAVELWKSAKPLYERSSQMKDINQIDAKLAKVDLVVVVECEEQLQQLEEEDNLVHGTNVGDEGKQGVMV